MFFIINFFLSHFIQFFFDEINTFLYLIFIENHVFIFNDNFLIVTISRFRRDRCSLFIHYFSIAIFFKFSRSFDTYLNFFIKFVRFNIDLYYVTLYFQTFVFAFVFENPFANKLISSIFLLLRFDINNFFFFKLFYTFRYIRFYFFFFIDYITFAT